MSHNIKNLEKIINSPNTVDPHRLLRNARVFMGVSRGLLAERMGISYETLTDFEMGRRRIPNSILIKLYMFGIDFWMDKVVLEN